MHCSVRTKIAYTITAITSAPRQMIVLEFVMRRSTASAKNVAAPMIPAAAAGRITLRKIAGRVVTDRRMAMRSSTVMVT